MAVNFPSNPTNGQTITVSGITYAYDSTQGVWSDNPQGLTQAIDALTDVDTSTSAPSNGQVLQWNSTDSEWQPADAGAGVTVYATIDDLPLTGVTEGSMALVDSTDKLYIYSDTGWYSISIVNQTPTISGVSATYALATDGTATTVTVTATDPEGIPLTYSIVSDTSGSVATVAQGTGSNTNQWTITPSTNTADAGNFTLVFRASDGTNIASASSTFTLAFGPAVVQDSNYTTALITSVGANNAVNNSFTDSSSNSHTITANGNVTQNTFSPYRSGGYSTYFDGSGDSLTFSGAVLPTSGAFTVQCWAWLEDNSNACLWSQGTSGATQRTAVAIDSGNWYAQIGSTVVGSGTAVLTNEWVFVEFQYTGSQIELFINGASVGSASVSVNAQSTSFNVGTYWLSSYDLEGYITDLRIISGTPSGASTVPDERLTAVTNTELLACHLPYIADGSTNSHSITVNGNTKTEPFAPYDYAEYDADDHGGSIYFDGTGDYLSVADGSWITLGSSDFTIECWAYNTATSGSRQDLFGQGNSAGQAFSISTELYINSNRTVGGGVYVGAQAYLTSTATVPVNTWNHIVLARDGTTLRLYINGVQSATTSVGTGTVTDQSTDFSIGRVGEYNGNYFNGSISDFRFVKGTCEYPNGTTFTPPTAPLTAITNTSLLLSGTNAGIIDKSQSVNTITLNGSAKSSTAQTKYLTSSMSFAAQTDFLTAELPGTIGTGDFTIEWWAYFTNINPGGSNYRAILDMRHAGDTSNLWLQQSGNGSWSYYPNYPTTGFTSSTFSNNTWHHIAIARENGTIRFYVDGSLTGSGSDSFDYDSVFLTLNHYSSSSRRWTGYASDLRVTKGLARYTASDETANIPSAALEG